MRVRAGYWVRGMVLGGYWEGLYRCTTQLLEEGPVTSEAGPGSPAGAGVGGLQGRNTQCARAVPGTTLAVPGPAPCGRCTGARLAPPPGQ